MFEVLIIKRASKFSKPEDKKDLEDFEDEEAYQTMIVKKVLQGISVEKEELKKNQKSSLNIGIIVFTVVVTVFVYLNISTILNFIAISKLALIVEIGGILLIFILIMQFLSLKGAISKITTSLESLKAYNEVYNEDSVFLTRKQHLLLYGSIFDVKKDTINKTFDRLNNFSNTWLAISAGVILAALVSFLISTTIDAYSVLVIAITAILIFCVSQNLHGWLNYELSKKTKDLAFWWIALV